MKEVDLLVIGGGPSGICAAISALESGANVLIIDKNYKLGGQLIKQTHKFFGSEKQYASIRGINIAKLLVNKLKDFKDRIEIFVNTTVIGLYEDGVVTALMNDKYIKIKPKCIVISTGASEKVLSFPNNDLPGIYGAGAVQTLMNVYGVKPGKKVLMVGAGNIGLIVSYQLLQAGVEVVAVIDAADKIGGYLVHASKLTRMGVPIYIRHTVKKAIGTRELEKVVISKIDENYNLIPNTEKIFDVDTLCISVGLTPLVELLMQIGCEMKFVKELGGLVPIRDRTYETTIDGIFVAGDVSGVEEASSAMVEGFIAGLYAAKKIGYEHKNFKELINNLNNQLDSLRNGPSGVKIRIGLKNVLKEDAI